METPGSRSSPGYPKRRPQARRLFPFLRWVHVYVSMVSFLLILLFSVTGITLNHPEWEWVSRETVSFEEGVLPEGWRAGQEIDWLTVVEYLRSEHGVRGQLEDYRADDFEGAVAFRGPGYAADAFFDPESGAYDLMTARSGAVGVLNDLHRGHAGGTLWRAAVDIAAVFLILLSLTGIGLLVFLRRFRVRGLAVMGAGTVAVILIVFRALG